MELYNTLTRQLEQFKPLDDHKVRLYTCGLTVYSQPHIGNWVSYIYWDLLVRTLQYSGYNVERVQNITDVGHLTSDEDAGEDKMIKSALREGKTAWQVAEKYINISDNEAYDQLGLLRPEHMPRATDYIEQQIAFVKELESKGYTYTINDGVYFDTSKIENYGELARLDIEGLQFGARVADTGKKNPTDFALWKFSPQDQKRDMEWWSPWYDKKTDEKHPIGYPRAMQSDAMQGKDEQRTESYFKYDEGAAEYLTQQSPESTTSMPGLAGQQGGAVHGSWGFPGWHLECSVLSREFLGDQIDIHTGGIDHIPVHHTNEIAQTEAVTGKKFANYWLHANHIKVDGTKMSKSLGNSYTLQDIIDHGYTLDAFKLMIYGKHYRTEGNFTWEILEAAQNRLNNWRAAADLVWQLPEADDTDLIANITKALQNDLNSPEAVSLIDQAFDKAFTAGNSPSRQLLEAINSLFGINLNGDDITPEQKAILGERVGARDNKDWVKSDQLRDQLSEQGIVIKDTSKGILWHRKT